MAKLYYVNKGLKSNFNLEKLFDYDYISKIIKRKNLDNGKSVVHIVLEEGEIDFNIPIKNNNELDFLKVGQKVYEVLLVHNGPIKYFDRIYEGVIDKISYDLVLYNNKVDISNILIRYYNKRDKSSIEMVYDINYDNINIELENPYMDNSKKINKGDNFTIYNKLFNSPLFNGEENLVTDEKFYSALYFKEKDADDFYVKVKKNFKRERRKRNIRSN